MSIWCVLLTLPSISTSIALTTPNTVPYDQWFLTHIPPTWEIRHLKQHILAKCLHLPWDVRKIEPARDAVVETVAGLRGTGGGIGITGGGGMGVGDVTGRPPSPITFAPEERERPIRPIEVRCRRLRWTACSQKVTRS